MLGGGATDLSSQSAKEEYAKEFEKSTDEILRVAQNDERMSKPSGIDKDKLTLTAISPFTFHVSQKKRAKRKVAFTLAEVLITLGIIGIVAAMTMPALISKHEKKVIATRVKQSYSIISNAIKLSEAENGEAKYWNTNFSSNAIENTELFLKKYILPYLNNPEFCGNGLGDDVVKKCGAVVSVAGQTYILPNGVSAAFVSAGSRMINIESYILYLSLDVNGKKAPNRLGSDKFFFVLTPNKGLIPFGGDANINNRDDILIGKNYSFDGHTEFIACKQAKNDDNDAYYRHGCTLLLMFDNWEFKDDYPW